VRAARSGRAQYPYCRSEERRQHVKRDSSIQRSRDVAATAGWRCRATCCGPESVSEGMKTGRTASMTCSRWTGLRSGARGATGSRSIGCERRQGQVERQLQVVLADVGQALSKLPHDAATALWPQHCGCREQPLRFAPAQQACRGLWELQLPHAAGRKPVGHLCPQQRLAEAVDVDVQVQPELGIDGSNSIPTASHAVKRVMISLDAVANIGRQSESLTGRTIAANFFYIGSHTR
jgi:hypothetical protein